MAYVYILSNKSMPGLLKIGMTTNSPQERATQLSTTGVPGEFVVEEYWECSPGDLRKSEREIHRTLEHYRYQRNREFFRISLEKAKSEIEGYFRRISDLQAEREKKSELIKAQEIKINQALETKRRLESLVIDGVNDFMNEFNSKRQDIESRLEMEIPAEQIVKAFYPYKKKELNGRLVSFSGWEVRSGFSGFSGGKIPRELQEDNAKVYIFVGVTTKSIFSAPSTYGGFFAVSYTLHSGKMELHRNDFQMANSHFRKVIFPPTLYEFLYNLGFERLGSDWERHFGDISALKEEVSEGLQCPACGHGTLILRRRKRDGHPFLGCSSWPSCNFTFNSQPSTIKREK